MTDRLDPLATVGGKGDNRINWLIIKQITEDGKLDLPCSESSQRNYRAQLKNANYVKHTPTGGAWTSAGNQVAQEYLNGWADLLGRYFANEYPQLTDGEAREIARDAISELHPINTDARRSPDGDVEDAYWLYNEVSDDPPQLPNEPEPEPPDTPDYDDVREEAIAFLEGTSMFYTGSPLGSEPDWPEWPFSDAMLRELDDRHGVALNAGYKLYRVR